MSRQVPILGLHMVAIVNGVVLQLLMDWILIQYLFAREHAVLTHCTAIMGVAQIGMFLYVAIALFNLP